MKKCIISIFLASVLLLNLLMPPAFAIGWDTTLRSTNLTVNNVTVKKDPGLKNFHKFNTYTPGQFSDVPSGSLWADNVQTVYEYNLMNGMSSSFFDTEGNLSYAQAIVLACRIHSIYYTGKALELSGDPWFRPYVNYAMDNDLITRLAEDKDNQFFDQTINRDEFAAILGKAMPDEALPPVNTVEDGAIPDVSMYSGFSSQIYRLYRAGILTGNDEKGTFSPDSPITRGAVAAIISRMAIPSLRRQLTLLQEPFNPVPMNQLANLKSLRKGASNDQLAQAYDIALDLVTPFAGLPVSDKLYEVATAMRKYFEENMDYSMESSHYNDPYGYFVLCEASCAGCTRATGLCLNILGIPYEHVNENQYSHQWCRVNVNGVYWICDAYGLYCGPEPAPYAHPYF